jgi:hypothetical protein
MRFEIRLLHPEGPRLHAGMSGGSKARWSQKPLLLREVQAIADRMRAGRYKDAVIVPRFGSACTRCGQSGHYAPTCGRRRRV